MTIVIIIHKMIIIKVFTVPHRQVSTNQFPAEVKSHHVETEGEASSKSLGLLLPPPDPAPSEDAPRGAAHGDEGAGVLAVTGVVRGQQGLVRALLGMARGIRTRDNTQSPTRRPPGPRPRLLHPEPQGCPPAEHMLPDVQLHNGRCGRLRQERRHRLLARAKVIPSVCCRNFHGYVFVRKGIND